VFTIPDLLPGDSYIGPTGPSDAGDLCKCNTVVYSLMSACDACQDALWFSCVFAPFALSHSKDHHGCLFGVARYDIDGILGLTTAPPSTL